MKKITRSGREGNNDYIRVGWIRTLIRSLLYFIVELDAHLDSALRLVIFRPGDRGLHTDEHLTADRR